MTTPELLPEHFPQRTLQIDDDGYFVANGLRLDDVEACRPMLQQLRCDERGRVYTRTENFWIGVEAFDAPLVARQISQLNKGEGLADFPYGFSTSFPLNKLSCDEWDRFHGITHSGIPFVMSRAAQFAFFDLLDSFDDDSFTVAGIRYPMQNWLIDNPAIDSTDFWTNIYTTEEPQWELGQETPILPDVLAQLKIPRSRVLCLGAGSGNDAAYFARHGHIVTAVDISAAAIERAKIKYSGLGGLTLLQADVFNLPKNLNHFDIIFEHTCYCAIRPTRRTELTKVWRQHLAPDGHLLGIFFCVERRNGPPFGGSEWEIQRRLSPHFEFLYWTRWKKSLPRRQGMELVVYARRK